MVAEFPDEGLPCAFVLADAVHGSDARFRRMLEARGQAHVLAVRSNHTLRIFEDWQLTRTDPETMIAGLPQDACHRTPGRRSAQARAPRVRGCMIGPACRWHIHPRRASPAGRLRGGACGIRASRPVISSPPDPKSALPRWPLRQACVGQSRDAACGPGMTWGSITVRRAHGMGGTAT
jgi:hypothetical protein